MTLLQGRVQLHIIDSMFAQRNIKINVCVSQS